MRSRTTTPSGRARAWLALSLVPGLDRTFLVMNGDLLTDLDFDALVRFHREQRSILTIATHQREVKIDLGVLEVGEDQRVTAYYEKPTHSYRVSMGIYVY